ncbi:MAG TPA: hypothetical protein PKN91_09335, partial [Steroidobacteraceae bacterium]|nr:hypothetical protein [Steroidobacteraceae bacterium]
MAIVAAGIPWKQLILLAPDIAKGAKAIWGQWKSKPVPEPIDANKSPGDQLAAISKRLLALEANEANQSRLVSEMADQVQVIAVGLRETAARQTVIIWVAGAALLLAI